MGMTDAWVIPLLPAAAFGAMLVAFILVFPVIADFTDALAQHGEGFAGASNSIQWLRVPDELELRLGVHVDAITLVMLVVVSFVALMVQVYSLGYMRGDARYGWFYAVLSLFAASMLALVLADNFLLLYFTWELVGLCSYLLIGHYSHLRSAAEAAKKAFITTRIGDLGLLIGILLLWRSVGTFDMSETFRAAKAGEIDQAYLP